MIVTIIVVIILAAVIILNLTGENGVITKAREASFRNEMAMVKEQVSIKLQNAKRYDEPMVGFTKVTEQDGSNKWDSDLKKEIIYWGKVDIGISEITKEYAKNNADEIFESFNLLDNLYYVDIETSKGKQKTYLYDAKGNVVYKIEITRIGKYKVHSIEELNDSKEGSSLQDVISTQSEMVTVDETSYYEPNLSGFALSKTSIVYYEVKEDSTSTDLDTQIVSADEYIKNGRKRTITKGNKTYEFYNYAKQRWANILVENNDMKSYWVWIPRYCYKEGDVSDVKFIDLNSTPDEGYIVHSDFADGKKGIWASKYEPIQTANTTVSNFPYYLPDLTGFNKDNTYIEVFNKEQNKFDETPLKNISDLNDFAKKNNWFNYNEQVWANIKVYEPQSKTESWWVWIPRYAYSITGNNTSVIFIDLNNRPLDGSTLPSNYIVHSAFEDGKKGIWVSKYEPVQKISEVGATNHVNPPDLRGYNVDNTFIECYDSKNNTFKEQTLRSILSKNSVINSNNVVERVDIDYSKIKGTWYSYDKQIWANIKVKKDDVESWWVWIPRYAYNILNQETSIIFLDVNGNTLDGKPLPSNYIPHSAFNDAKEGIWVSKYEPIQK